MQGRARLARRIAGEDAFGIVEMVVAISVLGVGILVVTGSLGLGLRMVGEGRQRQAASQVAADRIEHLRSIPYDNVALTATVVHSSDPESPDFWVDVTNTTYDITQGDAQTEALLVDSTNGQIPHLESGVTSGTTVLDVYQFVTWVDDASIAGTENYKRITVVAKFRNPSVRGVDQTVTAGALVTPGNVTVPGESTTPTQGTPGASPSPSTPPTACDAEIEAPEGDFAISSGTGSEIGFTASTTISIVMAFTDDCSPILARFSNDGVAYGADNEYDPANPTVSWTLETGDGAKSVWAKVRDGLDNEAILGPLAIVLDTTKPTVPGTLSAVATCVGSADRSVDLTWGASADDNWSGYRVYQSINDGAYAVIVTTSLTSATPADTHKKTLDSVRYYVVAYDKAGNESDATNVVSLSKNQCT